MAGSVAGGSPQAARVLLTGSGAPLLLALTVAGRRPGAPEAAAQLVPLLQHDAALAGSFLAAALRLVEAGDPAA